MIASMISGHVNLADWFLLFAIVAFGLALAADLAAGRSGSSTAAVGPSTARWVRPLGLAGLVLLSLALWVL